MLCTIGLTGCGESKISEAKAHYHVIFQTKDAQYVYDINAKTGAIVSKSHEPIVD